MSKITDRGAYGSQGAVRAKKVALTALCALFALFFAMTSWLKGMGTVFAEESAGIDGTKIEEDLKDLDLSSYPANADGTVSVIIFQEYGYSAIESDGDFQLYFYIYNPKETELSFRSGAQTANMAVEYDGEGNPVNYSNVALTILDYTDNFRFYKMKVANVEGFARRAREYAATHGGERRYDVAGIQLWKKGSASAEYATDHAIEATYRVTGYAKGFGINPGAESTLAIDADKLETIRLDVRSTYWRSEGLNANGAGHHDQLTSVYFAIPKEKIQTYGNLYAVKCAWDERRTSPIIVSTNAELVADVNSHLGQDASGAVYQIADQYHPANGYHDSYAAWAYNHPNAIDKTPVGYVFSANSDVLSRKISTQEITEWIKAKNFADYLFTSDVDAGRTYGAQEHTFYADELFDLKSFNSTASGWDKFCLNWQTFFSGKKWDFGKDYTEIEPIKYVTDQDFNGTDAANAERLFVNEEDYGAFKSYYDDRKGKNDVFLLRFAVTDYYANLQSVMVADQIIQWIDDESTYMARETVFLDFDIIDLTFKTESGVETVIPVVSDPIDIIAGIDPPRVSDYSWLWYAVIGVIGLSLIGILSAALLKNGEGKQ